MHEQTIAEPARRSAPSFQRTNLSRARRRHRPPTASSPSELCTWIHTPLLACGWRLLCAQQITQQVTSELHTSSDGPFEAHPGYGWLRLPRSNLGGWVERGGGSISSCSR